MKLAVVGKDVSKSVSPQIHNFIASKLNKRISYDKISVPEIEFESRIESILSEYDGLNFTIPYKLTVIPHLERLAGDAKTFGAVNTVNTKDLAGYNTDGLGFMLMLKNNGVVTDGKKYLVIGAGGAGRSVAKKLLDGGAEVYVYDKNAENARRVAAEFEGVTCLDEIAPYDYYGIVNASGVGMHSTEGISPVGEELISRCEVAIDLIYVPKKSEFLRIAESLNKKIINGEAMLFYQAYFADCIYFNLIPDDGEAKKLFEEFTKEQL
ncbi:MAG: shikimate dehydrogenase [Clostridia bacterium]|nr:shikimate dehydrogenase [Clostridia bacterium]